MNSHRCVALAVGLLTAAASAGMAQGEVAKTLDQWKHRQGLMKSVRYTVVGTEETNDDPLPNGQKLPPGPKERPYRATVLIDVPSRRYRTEITEQVLSVDRTRWTDRVTTNAFNGKAYQTAVPKDRNDRSAADPDVYISSGNLGQMSVEPQFWPLFSAHGFVPTATRPLRPDRLPADHPADEFEFRGSVTFAGNNCSVLRTAPVDATTALSDELWVSPVQDGAVLRHVYQNGKNPWIRVDATYQKADRGWFPVSWSYTWTSGGKVRRIQRLRVESVEVDPAVREDDFTLPIEPGMVVYSDTYPDAGSGLDPSRPAFKKYTAGSQEVIEERGMTTADGQELPPSSVVPGWVWWVVAAAVAAAGGVITFRVWRRRPRA